MLPSAAEFDIVVRNEMYACGVVSHPRTLPVSCVCVRTQCFCPNWQRKSLWWAEAMLGFTAASCCGPEINKNRPAAFSRLNTDAASVARDAPVDVITESLLLTCLFQRVRGLSREGCAQNFFWKRRVALFKKIVDKFCTKSFIFFRSLESNDKSATESATYISCLVDVSVYVACTLRVRERRREPGR